MIKCDHEQHKGLIKGAPASAPMVSLKASHPISRQTKLNLAHSPSKAVFGSDTTPEHGCVSVSWSSHSSLNGSSVSSDLDHYGSSIMRDVIRARIDPMPGHYYGSSIMRDVIRARIDSMPGHYYGSVDCGLLRLHINSMPGHHGSTATSSHYGSDSNCGSDTDCDHNRSSIDCDSNCVGNMGLSSAFDRSILRPANIVQGPDGQ